MNKKGWSPEKQKTICTKIGYDVTKWKANDPTQVTELFKKSHRGNAFCNR